jgi:hypothetical protein
MPVAPVPLQLRGKILAAVPDIRDCVDQMPRRAILKQVAVPSCANHFPHNLVVRSAGHHNNSGSQRLSPDTTHQFNPVHLGKVEIHHGNIGMQAADLRQRGFAVSRTPHYFHFRLTGKDCREPVTTEGVFIGQKNSYFCGGRHLAEIGSVFVILA